MYNQRSLITTVLFIFFASLLLTAVPVLAKKMSVEKIEEFFILAKSISFPGPQPRGLAWDGKNLWCSYSKIKKIYPLSPKNGEVISSIDPPVSKAVNAPPDSGRGLAWDGKYL